MRKHKKRTKVLVLIVWRKRQITKNGRKKKITEFLLVREKGEKVWGFPGGKRIAKEIRRRDRYTVSLIRELKQELPDVGFTIVKKYKVFNGIAPHSRYKMELVTFIGKTGEDPTKTNGLRAARETEEAKWMRPDETQVSDMAWKAIRSLRKERKI